MCGRYELNATPLELSNHFGDLLPNTRPLAGLPTSYNIPPSTAQPVIRYGETDGANVVDLLTWGFRPTWAKRAWINARVETLFTNTAFRESASKRRCLVIATGWYEWQQAEPKRKVPFYVHLDRPFAFAGIWTARKIGDAWEKSFAIVTAPQARRSRGSMIECRSSCIHRTTRRGLTRAQIGRPISPARSTTAHSKRTQCPRT